jgi:hypothetical protein
MTSERKMIKTLLPSLSVAIVLLNNQRLHPERHRATIPINAFMRHLVPNGRVRALVSVL